MKEYILRIFKKSKKPQTPILGVGAPMMARFYFKSTSNAPQITTKKTTAEKKVPLEFNRNYTYNPITGTDDWV